MIGFDILFLGGITMIAFCVARELWQDPRLSAAFCAPCRQQIRKFLSPQPETGDKAKPNLLGFTAVLFGAALIGMIINLTADEALDDKDWVPWFPPFGCWQEEDQLKLKAVDAAKNLEAVTKVKNIVLNHADLDSAKSLIQHAYPAVQKAGDPKILTGLRYEFLVVKVLRVCFLLVVGLYLMTLVRGVWMARVHRDFKDRWVGLLLTTLVAFFLFELFLWLWSAQSERYYKKLLHAYILQAALDDKSLTDDLRKGNGAPASPKAGVTTVTSFATSNPIEHFGACDGSNGIASGPSHFVGTSDENNVIRLFEIAGLKSQTLLDLNGWLGFTEQNGKYRESDLEGAARIGDLIFWIGSHGANNEGKERKERQVFFATTVTGSGENTKLEPFGQPYKDLLRDFLADTRLNELKFAEASQRAPKDPGAINIEGLCAAGNSLLIGFRNPIPGGKALILPLTNPRDVVEKGAPAKFDNPILLNLDGLGIRAMVWWHDAFLIVAGDYRDSSEGGAKPPKLFRWEGGDKQPGALQVKLDEFNPEGALVFEKDGKQHLLLLSDDGSRKIDGVEMKDLEQSKQRFRSVRIEKSRGD